MKSVEFVFLRFYMDLESEENAEKDEFFEECLNDPTLRDQLSIMTRKFRNKTQVRQWVLKKKKFALDLSNVVEQPQQNKL